MVDAARARVTSRDRAAGLLALSRPVFSSSILIRNRAYPEIDLKSLLNAQGNAVAASDAQDASGCGDNGTLVQTAGGNAAQYTNYPTSQALAAVPRLTSIPRQMSLVHAPAPNAPTLIVRGREDEIMFVP